MLSNNVNNQCALEQKNVDEVLGLHNVINNYITVQSMFM